MTISGIATVSISGTPTVTISGTPSVNIANTPSVTISSGSVTIANASIGVINATGTKITSARPPVVLGTLQATPNTTATGNFTLPADIQGLVIQLIDPLANYVHIKVSYHDLVGTIRYVPLELYTFSQFIYVVPILPVATDSNLNPFSTIDVTLQSAVGLYADVGVVALFDSSPLWMQVFPLPQLEPNQTPKPVYLTLANNVAQWVIAAAANIRITLFTITILYFNPGGAGISWLVGHNTALPGNGTMPINAETYLQGLQINIPFTYDFRGAQLPRGEGLYASQLIGAAQNFGVLVIYSLD